VLRNRFGSPTFGGMTLADSGEAPATDGELRRNATDVYVRSGGFVRNLSQLSSKTKIYHFGGHDGTSAVNTIYEYDPVADSISTQTATLPTALQNALAAMAP